MKSGRLESKGFGKFIRGLRDFLTAEEVASCDEAAHRYAEELAAQGRAVSLKRFRIGEPLCVVYTVKAAV